MDDFPSDLFSTAIRRELLWSEILRLTHELSIHSLINISSVTNDTRSKRIETLENFEAKNGFVYFGEKLWLAAQQNGLELSYEQWVVELLLKQKRLCFEDPTIELEGNNPVSGGQNLEGMIRGIDMPEPVGLGKRYSCFHDDCGMKFSVSRNTPLNGIDFNGLVQAYHLMHNIGYYAEKAVQFLAWRGDQLEEGTDRLRWESLGIRTDRADSRRWGMLLAECHIDFFEHDVCVALACDNGLDESITEEYSKKISKTSKLRAEERLPFWM